MLDKSQKFGTVLTVGPRLAALDEEGFAEDLLWEENYPEQEESTPDGRGRFQHTREWIEKASLEKVFDLWCRGNNLIGYAQLMLAVTKTFRKIWQQKENP